MSDSLHLYYEALDRLKEGTPVLVPKETKISNDTVSLEAGRKKGSIKKSRNGFFQLIEEIKQAQKNQRNLVVQKNENNLNVGNQQQENNLQTETDGKRYRLMYETLLTERAGVLLEAFKQREEIRSLHANLATQAVELSNIKALASTLEAELTRLRAGRLRAIPVQPKKVGQ